MNISGLLFEADPCKISGNRHAISTFAFGGIEGFVSLFLQVGFILHDAPAQE